MCGDDDDDDNGPYPPALSEVVWTKPGSDACEVLTCRLVVTAAHEKQDLQQAADSLRQASKQIDT